MIYHEALKKMDTNRTIVHSINTETVGISREHNEIRELRKYNTDGDILKKGRGKQYKTFLTS